MIIRKEVEHIAKLARLGLSEREIEKMRGELSKILDYIEKLKEVDVSEVEPTSHSVTRALAKRGDEQSSSTKLYNILWLSINVQNVKRPGSTRLKNVLIVSRNWNDFRQKQLK